MTTKATFYLEEDILRAFKIKAAQSDKSLSALVNEAMRSSLSEDEEDKRDIKVRRKQTSRSFDDILKDMKRAGKI